LDRPDRAPRNATAGSEPAETADDEVVLHLLDRRQHLVLSQPSAEPRRHDEFAERLHAIHEPDELDDQQQHGKAATTEAQRMHFVETDRGQRDHCHAERINSPQPSMHAKPIVPTIVRAVTTSVARSSWCLTDVRFERRK